jgi:radical S-adenosyl methionine domain-containing protein 2
MNEYQPLLEDLVLNWHVNEACNFKCRYCYAHWRRDGRNKPLWRDEAASLKLLEQMYGFFSPTNHSNALTGSIKWNSLRLSLAGGEPTLLGNRLTAIASQAKSIGYKVSLITNGSRPDVVLASAPYLGMIGFSIDSINPYTNADIGRVTKVGSGFRMYDALNLIERLREVRPNIVIKINTVVNLANCREDLSELIERVNPDRWKIMRMLPATTNELSIDPQEFQSFVRRHEAFRSIMTVEGNDEMKQSYIMVDPYGRFFQNGANLTGYSYSRPIVNIGVREAFSEIDFDSTKFSARY